MNKSYTSVWNEALGAWVAASEIVKARGKRSSGSAGLGRVVRRALFAAALPSALLFFGVSPVANAAGVCVRDIGTAQIYGQSTGVTAGCNSPYASSMSGSYGLIGTDGGTLGLTSGKFQFFMGPDKSTTQNVLTGTASGTGVLLNGLAAGSLGLASTDAVNGSQLFTTNQNVAANTANIATNTTNIAGNTTAITKLDGRVTTVEGSVSDLTNNVNSGSVGLVKQDATTKAITLAGDKAGTSVNFAGTDGARTLSGVKAATLAAGSTEAVNGGQLFATNQNVTANTANIATNTTNIAGNTTAIAGLDSRVTTVEGSAATNLANATRYFKAGGNNDGTDDASAAGVYAAAVGMNAKADGTASVAIGARAQATNDVAGRTGGIAIGSSSTAGNNDSGRSGTSAGIAIGNETAADRGSVALGNNANATRSAGLALGSSAVVRLVNAEVHERMETLDAAIGAAQIRIHALSACHALGIGAGAHSSAICIDAFAMKAESRPVKTPHGIS